MSSRKETAVEQKFATDFNKLLRGNTRYETSEGSPRLADYMTSQTSVDIRGILMLTISYNISV